MPITRYAAINDPTASLLEEAYALNQKKMNAIVAAGMGTGCNTIPAQMAADMLECAFDRIIVHGVDTDVSPYDFGSCASSTTYVTGMAVVKAANTLHKMIIQTGAKLLSIPKEEADFDGEKVFEIDTLSQIVAAIAKKEQMP